MTRDPISDPFVKTHVSYRPDIDGLRAIAIAIVIGCHAFPRALPGGFVGVDIFFVISGYLITQLILTGLQTESFSLGSFYQRRVRRIVPALLLVLLICCLFGWFALLSREFAQLGRSIAWCASFLANVLFARAVEYFGPTAELTPLLHLWSLGVEEQFYLAWPVLMLLAVRRGRTMLTLSAIIVVSLAISIWGAWHSPPKYFFLAVSRAWELAVGGLLAAWCHGSWVAGEAALPVLVRHRLAAEVASIVGLALIVGSVLLLRGDLAFPGAWGLIPSSAATLLIATGPSAFINRRLLATRPMVFVGLISYPLFLWHWPLLSFAKIILGRPPPPALAATVIVTAVLLSYVSCRLVENPIRYGNPRGRVVAVLLAGLTILAVLGGVVERRWIPARLSGPAFAEWEQVESDWHVPMIRERNGLWTLTVASRRPQRTLFIGDSHIQQYWARITRVIETHSELARSAEFMTYIECPPLPGINSTSRGSSCDILFEQAMEEALRSDVDTVVFGAFWELYMLGEFSAVHSPWRTDYLFSVRDRLRTPLKLDSPGTRIALEGFQRAVSKLVCSGRRVFIVLSNPTSPRFDPLFLLPAAARLSSPSLDRLIVDSDKQFVDVAPFETFVAPLMMRLRDIAVQTGATIIDPRSTLCDEMTCRAIDENGVPIHMDSNHFTSSFTRENARFIDEMLLGPDTAAP